MKKIFGAMLIVVLLSGCGDSVKSVEEYSKLDKAELDKMFKECDKKIDSELSIFTSDGLKLVGEIEQIIENIQQSRGKTSELKFKSMETKDFGNITDDELSKFGNGKLAEIVSCGRIGIASEKAKK